MLHENLGAENVKRQLAHACVRAELERVTGLNASVTGVVGTTRIWRDGVEHRHSPTATPNFLSDHLIAKATEPLHLYGRVTTATPPMIGGNMVCARD